MFSVCRRLKSRVMVLESIQSFLNTVLQSDAMPGVKSLFTAEINEAVILQVTCEEMIVVACRASLVRLLLHSAVPHLHPAWFTAKLWDNSQRSSLKAVCNLLPCWVQCHIHHHSPLFVSYNGHAKHVIYKNKLFSPLPSNLLILPYFLPFCACFLTGLPKLISTTPFQVSWRCWWRI